MDTLALLEQQNEKQFAIHLLRGSDAHKSIPDTTCDSLGMVRN